MERLAISRLAREPRSHSTALPDPDPIALERCSRADLPVGTIDLARFLIGASLVREGDGAGEARAVARIIETEAYLPDDAASHAYRGRTQRNGAMFFERGHAYVYFIYGNHFCLNVTSEAAGIGAAVLLRAAEPLAGERSMRARSGERIADRDLLRGPGRLARAFGVDKRFDGVDLCAGGPLWLAHPTTERPMVACSARIGLLKNVDAPLRFYATGNPLVSGPKRLRAGG